MKVLLIFALVCATSTIVQANIEDFFEGIGKKFEEWGEDFGGQMENWGENFADNIAKLAKDGKLSELIQSFLDSMKDLRQINKDKLKELFDSDQGLLAKCLQADAEKWDQTRLDKEFEADANFQKAYKLMQNEEIGSSASVPALGLGGSLAMTLLLMI